MNVDGIESGRFNPFGAGPDELVAYALDDAGLLGEGTTIDGRPARLLLEAFYRRRGEYREATRIGDLLVRAGAISREQLAVALELQRDRAGKLLGEALVELGACRPGEIERLLAAQGRIRGDLEDLEEHRRRIRELRERLRSLDR